MASGYAVIQIAPHPGMSLWGQTGVGGMPAPSMPQQAASVVSGGSEVMARLREVRLLPSDRPPRSCLFVR